VSSAAACTVEARGRGAARGARRRVCLGAPDSAESARREGARWESRQAEQEKGPQSET
jgi:hypothetical protein